MRLLEELRHLLWSAFHEGGKWALDATEKKGEPNPAEAFNAWLKSEYPILGVIPAPREEDPR
jgi:hypothetical protein